VWLPPVVPSTFAPEFLSITEGGVTYRTISQRMRTSAGEFIVQLADGSDARQHWLQTVLVKVLLPNLILLLLAGIGVHWAVKKALQPLLVLKDAVQHRSPKDLSPLDESATPFEVKPLVHALNQLFTLLNAQTELQRQFVADAAHQLRTPLASLQAQVEVWAQQSRHLDEQTQMPIAVLQIRRLRDACRRTAQLASQLLTLSKTDHATTQHQTTTCIDCKSLCEDVLECLLDAAGHKQIDLGLEVQPLQAKGHEWLLRELLSNLLENAICYTPVYGHITLRCVSTLDLVHPADGALDLTTVRPSDVWLQVQDNGPGIDRAERTKVIQRFYRVQGSGVDGNGLGLAIAYEIARIHQTELHLGQSPNGGLLVSLRLQGNML
jgi:two-component system, OmpR family, sensor histidine kinase TctE